MVVPGGTAQGAAHGIERSERGWRARCWAVIWGRPAGLGWFRTGERWLHARPDNWRRGRTFISSTLAGKVPVLARIVNTRLQCRVQADASCERRMQDAEIKGMRPCRSCTPGDSSRHHNTTPTAAVTALGPAANLVPCCTACQPTPACLSCTTAHPTPMTEMAHSRQARMPSRWRRSGWANMSGSRTGRMKMRHTTLSGLP